MALIHGHGTNDMGTDWYRQSDLNRKLYDTWVNMLRKCYPRGKMDQLPTYLGCTVCERWFSLKGFLEDIKDIPRYDDFIAGLEGKGPRLHFVPRKKEYNKDSCEFTHRATRRNWAKVEEEE